MLADVLGKKLVLTEQDELGTLGCAILAYTGIGYYPSLRDAVKGMVREKRDIGFDGTAHAVYEKKFSAFRAYGQMETLPPER